MFRDVGMRVGGYHTVSMYAWRSTQKRVATDEVGGAGAGSGGLWIQSERWSGDES